MSENLLAYWTNWIASEKDMEITKDGYIFKYTIINQHSNNGSKNWVCCNSKKKLFSFIKNIILPSLQISRTIGMKHAEVYFDVLEFNETIDILLNSKIDNCSKFIDTFERWIKDLEEMEKN